MAGLIPLLWPAWIWPAVHHLFQTGISVLEWTRKASVTSNRQAGYPHGKSQALFFPHHCIVLHFLPMARAWWTSVFLYPTANVCCSHIVVPLNYIPIPPYHRNHSPHQWFHLLPYFSHYQKPYHLLFPAESADLNSSLLTWAMNHSE